MRLQELFTDKTKHLFPGNTPVVINYSLKPDLASKKYSHLKNINLNRLINEWEREQLRNPTDAAAVPQAYQYRIAKLHDAYEPLNHHQCEITSGPVKRTGPDVLFRMFFSVLGF